MNFGVEDPRLRARIESVHALPGVRAGSALLSLDDCLLAVQDDAWCVAWIALPGLSITLQVLGGDGAPLSKAEKPDFEAALRTHDGDVYLLGSGSKRNRRTLARIGPDRRVTLREAPELYDGIQTALGLEQRPNIEAAVVDDRQLRLFHRGAGAAPSACVDLPLSNLDGGSFQLLARHWFQLGELDGVALHFTDAVSSGSGRSLFLAAAERTDDAFADGPVAGSAVGLIDGYGQALNVRWTRLLERDGQPSRRKGEGLVVDRDGRSAWVLTDPDHPDRPAELCRVVLEGFT
ncbi:MAG: hypothetical protein WC809_01010 [Sinimarinibacterium sp.]|jgi:hypothetical protein